MFDRFDGLLLIAGSIGLLIGYLPTWSTNETEVRLMRRYCPDRYSQWLIEMYQGRFVAFVAFSVFAFRWIFE